MKRVERNRAGNKALEDAKAAVETARALNDELRGAISEAKREVARYQQDAVRYKQFYESQQKHNKIISDRLQHQERLVRTLLDALADKYHPIPTNIKLSMDYRVAEAKNE